MAGSGGMQPRRPTALDPMPTDNDLIVSDLHGDSTGLSNLLKEAKFNPDKQRLFSLGDLTDRGHDTKGVIDTMNRYGAFHVASNHDFKHFRNAKHMVNQAATGKKNPITPNPEMADTISQLGSDYLKYMLPMGDYPAYLPFQDRQGNGYLVHAGFDPFNDIENQNIDKMLVRRFHPSPGEFVPNETDEYKYWQRFYAGHLGHIISGHNPMPRHDLFPNTTNLDGGGTFGSLAQWGGHHRALRLGDRKLFQASGSPEAETNYRKIWGDKLKMHI